MNARNYIGGQSKAKIDQCSLINHINRKKEKNIEVDQEDFQQVKSRKGTRRSLFEGRAEGNHNRGGGETI